MGHAVESGSKAHLGLGITVSYNKQPRLPTTQQRSCIVLPTSNKNKIKK